MNLSLEELHALPSVDKAFTATGLSEAWELALQHRDESGKPSENMPTTLVVPPQMHFVALQLLMAMRMEQKLPLLCLYEGATHPYRWYLLGSKATIAFDRPWTEPLRVP